MAAEQKKMGKKLPKRAARRKELESKRHAQHARQEERKSLRVLAQQQREEKNRALRKNGLPTPWEQAKARRYASRH